MISLCWGHTDACLFHKTVMQMATDPFTPSEEEPEPNARFSPPKSVTWLPILGGVLCGMIVLCLLSTHEPPFFYHITAWLFDEAPPAKIIEPRSLHFALFMLTVAGAGGAVGVLFSEWRKRRAILFLLAILAVIAAFDALGSRLESAWH
jgi:hypothetical protein